MGKRVLVCGATGYLGGHVVSEAKAKGHFVRALVRDVPRAKERLGQADELFEGQATDDGTLADMCEGIDVVISSLGNRTLRRRPTCWEVDWRAKENIVRRARAANVPQIIFVSVLRGPEARTQVHQIEARERVVDGLQRGPLDWTIIRPSGFFNDMSEFLEMARRGSIWLPGDGEVPFNPVHGADLARVIIDQVADPNSFGKQIPVGGPDTLTMNEIARLAFEAVGRPPRIRHLPLWTLRAAAAMISPFNINVSSLVAMFTVFAEGDAVCDAYGDHHLADFYSERVASSDRDGGLAVR